MNFYVVISCSEARRLGGLGIHCRSPFGSDECGVPRGSLGHIQDVRIRACGPAQRETRECREGCSNASGPDLRKGGATVNVGRSCSAKQP